MPHNTEHRHSGAHYGRHIVAIISAVFVAVSCSGPSLSPNPTNPTISDRPQPPTGVPAPPAATQTATPAATQTATPVASTGPSARPPSEHRIGVRTVGGAGEFFDRETNQRFTPRGANLVRLAGGHHSTLDPAFYDPAQLAIALERMASGGYNVARVFLNHDRGGLSGSSTGLSAAYMDNVDDFLRLARASDMFVIFTQDWLPEGESYAFEPDPLIDNVNLLYLSAGGVEANARYFHDFAAALIERQAPLDALLAYELRNELYLTESYAPFSLSSGHVGTANGRTYDLASGVERQQLMEQGVVFWVDRMRAAIRDVDPTALVTVGFFQPKGPNPTRADDDRMHLLADSLRDKARRHGVNVLRAINLLDGRDSMSVVIDNLNSRDPNQRANALETLESGREAQLVRPLLKLWESAETASPVARNGWSETLIELMRESDAWLRACAALAASVLKEPKVLEALTQLAESDTDPVVRDAARRTVAILNGGPAVDTLPTLSLMERILFLRRVPLFADLSPADLKQVAAIANEHYFTDGEVIAYQGEAGNEMFIIVSGEVRVLVAADGKPETEVARRKPGEYVGEVSIISQEPRMASLVAAGDVRTLCIDRKNFEGLLRERPETSLAVMRVLCARLREMTK